MVLNRNIGCIEIIARSCMIHQIQVLNRNIGCIEILAKHGKRKAKQRLNRNIGCIEIFWLILVMLVQAR